MYVTVPPASLVAPLSVAESCTDCVVDAVVDIGVDVIAVLKKLHIGVSAADFLGAVSREHVHAEDLIRPLERIQAAGDLGPHVVGWNDD